MLQADVPRQNPLGPSIYILKNEGQEGKTGLFWEWVSVEGVGIRKG
jgi:hypothetical protein